MRSVSVICEENPPVRSELSEVKMGSAWVISTELNGLNWSRPLRVSLTLLFSRRFPVSRATIVSIVCLRVHNAFLRIFETRV